MTGQKPVGSVRLRHHRRHYLWSSTVAWIINAKGLLSAGWSPGLLRDCHGMGFGSSWPIPSESCHRAGNCPTEVDIDNLVRAKGAIFSAIETL
ncbi:MAG: hypothetical protein ACLU9S_13730 [Oscillospiraceae bacterium]